MTEKQRGRRSATRRHLRWVLPLVSAPTLYLTCALVLGMLSENRQAEPTVGQAFIVLALVATMALGPLALLVVAVVRGARVRREARRRAGRFTRSERDSMSAHAAAQAAAAASWQHAVVAATALLRGERPPTLAVWDVVPWHGETFYADVPLGYARYYGTTVQAAQTSGFFVGRPAFVLAGLASTALVNAAARSSARQQSADQWRDHATVRVVVSDQRLLVQRHGEWLSFAHTALTAVYPDLHQRALVGQYEGTSPLMLRGEQCPLATVVVVAAAHGPGALLHHPAMAPITASVHARALSHEHLSGGRERA